MQTQLDLRKEETKTIHSKCDELEAKLQQLRSSALELSMDTLKHFSDDEEDEPLVPLPDDAEIIEGEEDMDQDETAAPSRAEPAAKEATTEAETIEDIPSKAPSPKPQLSMSLEQPPDLDDELDASLKPLGPSIDDGTEGKVDDLQLDISGLGPDGLPVESAHDLSQLTPSDALVGGAMMDESEDPFAETFSHVNHFRYLTVAVSDKGMTAPSQKPSTTAGADRAQAGVTARESHDPVIGASRQVYKGSIRPVSAMHLIANPRDLFSSGKRDLVFVTIIAVLSSFALSTVSTITPSILALSALHAYSRILFPSVTKGRVGFLWAGLAVGGAFPNFAASHEALSTGLQSFVLLSVLSAFTSAIVVVAVYAEWALSRQTTSPAGKVLLFPAIWSSIWCTVPYLSPVGHLLTWSRGATLEAYGWMIPIFGTSSQDWIAAAWAVVLSEVFQTWYMGPVEQDNSYSEDDEIPQIHSNNTPILAGALILLIVPSYFVGNVLPLPVGNVDEATTFGVGCINPTFQRYKHYAPSFKDYLEETKKHQNRAKFLLWPEGAVTFDSDKERDEAFETIRANVSGAYVGVSFEQYVPDPKDKSGHKSLKKTGIAIIGKDSKEPYLTYYKRHLVPIVESYQLRHSSEPPALVNVSIARPKDVPKSAWGDRNVSVTASICLDFAMPLPFSHLETRPGLILAPARTWERSVGLSMWLQAKQRAQELNSMVLWCDGGEGGFSGIAGGGYQTFEQVGPGSWVKDIGIEHPFREAPTLYARWQDSTMLVYWIAILFPALSVANMGQVVSFIRGRRRETQPLLNSNQPQLIDYSSV
ncbi:hypothetical protein EST38_g3277 [Candolleomyces aberdarensis]|uniref:CN hydrolase domain-containing protein n=1 Tax=Candolleomyces aberdarensis TaxID=2316362 RepID=A0A4V1Q4M1_9AGAR|nr:hypothetical protein EST38_g3277 [Candolleomyces aberdarensis]